ncbi:DUF445 domain-containing protein [Dendrosporobacter sp. 1207_IL3150]|uniref:DUF445 domain-containing protein n=1 Tax=Dendrosporobacter sp. 1207_IL3150 TaxID=3084054 RepID=UPI002FDB5B4F
MKFKKTANIMLAVVFMFFAIAAIIKYHYPYSTAAAIFYVTVEAALIGGIADWFAVSALFGRPLGITWHTEIIPRNRERIAEALTTAIEEDLLSVEAIRKRLSNIEFIEVFIDWVDQKGGKEVLADMLYRQKALAWDEKSIQSIGSYLENVFKKNAKQIELAPQLGAVVVQALEQGKGEELLDFLLEELKASVEKPKFRRAVYLYIDELKHKNARSLFEKALVWIGEQTDSINIEEAANALCDELVLLLNDLTKKDHLVRQWINVRLIETANNLQKDTIWIEAIEDWKSDLIDQIRIDETITPIVSKAANSTYSPVSAWVAGQVKQYWEIFKKDQQLKTWFEAKLKFVAYRLIQKEHHLIGMIVRSVLGGFSNSDISRFVQDKTGDDLQWIRINGSIVGGIVGLLIYIFLHYIYEPVLQSKLLDIV